MSIAADGGPRSHIVQFTAPAPVRTVIRRLAERECSSFSDVIRRAILAAGREAGIDPLSGAAEAAADRHVAA